MCSSLAPGSLFFVPFITKAVELGSARLVLLLGQCEWSMLFPFGESGISREDAMPHNPLRTIGDCPVADPAIRKQEWTPCLRRISLPGPCQNPQERKSPEAVAKNRSEFGAFHGER